MMSQQLISFTGFATREQER